jgi:predicted nucleotidyltransferase component of viral defense system
MENIKSDEALRIWIINHLCDRQGEHAVLKGGMVLRLLGCPRYTNDLDYTFIPFNSKKEIVAPILEALKELQGVTIEHRIHSTNAQFDVVLKNNFGTFKTQVEANVAESCEAQQLSTFELSVQYEQTPRVILVMRFDVMLANKLAAWNERRLMRDLYDAYFMSKNMSPTPDMTVLKSRLQNIRYAKRVGGKTMPKKISVSEFCDSLESTLKVLTADDLENELRDYLDPQQFLGLDTKIRIALGNMIDQLRVHS